ncbi:MAG: DUF1848 family protein [Candidatus Pacearchaeota archaeon]|jgi:hypothetical protein|nr:DUF1848 domain-containing protein [Clostridia bacterium]
MSRKIGITEHGDAAFDHRWIKWVSEKNPAIIISKNPKKIYEIISELNVPYNIIVHCTITGNGGTALEPNAPSAKESLEYLYKFVELLGPQRVVLRIDPIMPISNYMYNSINVWKEAKANLKENMCRVRISFYDNYPHTQKRIEEKGFQLKYTSFNLPLDIRKRIWREFEMPALCAEEGLPSTPCISELDCQILGVEPGKPAGYQRTTCHCLDNKFELLNSRAQCAHKCLFCYFQKDHKGAKGLF